MVRFGHGTTVGRNALLTGRSAPTSLLITAGFGDVLEIGRLRRGTAGLRGPEVGDYHLRRRTPPLDSRERVLEIPERIDRTGKVLLPPDSGAVRQQLGALQDIKAVAVCLLWSTVNPVHELDIGALVERCLPGAFLCLSHQVAPAVGEYARASTTAADAALGPAGGHYLERLEGELRSYGLRVPVLMTISAGGVLPSISLAGCRGPKGTRRWTPGSPTDPT